MSWQREPEDFIAEGWQTEEEWQRGRLPNTWEPDISTEAE